jgi:hypothetical protein
MKSGRLEQIDGGCQEDKRRGRESTVAIYDHLHSLWILGERILLEMGQSLKKTNLPSYTADKALAFGSSIQKFSKLLREA